MSCEPGQACLEDPHMPRHPKKRADSHLEPVDKLSPCDPAGQLQSPKTPESRKYEKKIQNPPPRVGPPKIQKKYRKNTKTAQKRQVLGRFCIFSVFFPYVRGADPGGGFCIFSYFRHSGVFGLCSRPAGSQLSPLHCGFVCHLPTEDGQMHNRSGARVGFMNWFARNLWIGPLFGMLRWGDG